MSESSSRKEWQTYRFEQMAVMVNDRIDDPGEAGVERYVGLEHLDPDSLIIRRWGSPSDVEATKLRFRAGDIIFGRRRVYQRKLAVAHFEGICSAHAMVLRARPEVALPEFLPFYMQSDLFMERAKQISVGSLSPTINWKTLAKEEFSLPPPEEQRKIAEVLRALLSWYSSVRAIIGSASELKSSFARYVLSRRTEVPRVPLGSVAKFTSGGQIPVGSLPQLPTTNASVPVYGGNGLAGYVSAPLPGCTQPTVVVGRVGQYCGTTLLTDGPAWITDNALYPASFKSPTDMRFLAACLDGANLNRGKLGKYLPLITQTVVHSVEIPIVPLHEQQVLGRHYQDIIDAIRTTTKRLGEAEVIRNSVYTQLLGEAS